MSFSLRLRPRGMEWRFSLSSMDDDESEAAHDSAISIQAVLSLIRVYEYKVIFPLYFLTTLHLLILELSYIKQMSLNASY